jgi:hypothetical protein
LSLCLNILCTFSFTHQHSCPREKTENDPLRRWLNETQTRYERDEADNIPWQKLRFSAVSVATYNIFKIYEERDEADNIPWKKLRLSAVSVATHNLFKT